jgi:asparagine synthetase B (glutamine-hydrolysing)
MKRILLCGIAGIIDFSDHTPDDEGQFRCILGLIRHRRPDAFGIYRDNAAGLALTHLGIHEQNRKRRKTV